MKIIITSEMEIDDDFIDSKDTLKDDLLGEFVKIKSGLYDNMLCGHVVAVRDSDNTEERN